MTVAEAAEASDGLRRRVSTFLNPGGSSYKTQAHLRSTAMSPCEGFSKPTTCLQRLGGCGSGSLTRGAFPLTESGRFTRLTHINGF